MTKSLSPNNPQEFKEWVDQIEKNWLAGLIPNPKTAAVIVTNNYGKVLLLLRDDNLNISFPNCWSLPGGVAEFDELPEQAALRELWEETGLILELSFWRVYDSKPPKRRFIVEQYVYTGTTDRECSKMTMGEGQTLCFLSRDEINSLPIAYGFDKLINEYFDHQNSCKSSGT